MYQLIQSDILCSWATILVRFPVFSVLFRFRGVYIHTSNSAAICGFVFKRSSNRVDINNPRYIFGLVAIAAHNRSAFLDESSMRVIEKH